MAFLATTAALASAAPAQVPGVTREQMWFAPTTEDWKKPVLITFQRSWDDALEVAVETGKAILICVNMDGEIASEHHAGIRYRIPEIARIHTPFFGRADSTRTGTGSPPRLRSRRSGSAINSSGVTPDRRPPISPRSPWARPNSATTSQFAAGSSAARRLAGMR